MKGRRKTLADLLAETQRPSGRIPVGRHFDPPGQPIRVRPDTDVVHGRELSRVWLNEIDNHLVDAVAYGSTATHTAGPVSPRRTISEFADSELIMELLGRGYAAIKMPKDGSLPKVLDASD